MVLAVVLYGVGDFFQSVAVFRRQGFYGFAHGDGRCVGGIGGKKDAVSRAGHKRHKADNDYNTKRHADACGDGYNQAVQAGKKMTYSRAHRHSCSACAARSLCAASCIFCARVCICAQVVMLRTVSFAAVRSWR